MDAKLLRGIALLAGIVIVLVAAIVKVSSGGSDSSPNQPGTTTEVQAPADAIVVSVAYSPEKDILFKKAFATFNARKVAVNGHVVFVKGENVSSGAGLDRLKAGTLQPVIWTPSSSLWGRLLTQTADVTWVPRQNVSMFRTPLVIAMWEDQAQALGWPAQAARLGRHPGARRKNTQGWAKYGHPEWGPFRLGHTNPDFSTSGLSAVAAEYYAATGKTEGLTLADVEDPGRARRRCATSSRRSSTTATRRCSSPSSSPRAARRSRRRWRWRRRRSSTTTRGCARAASGSSRSIRRRARSSPTTR